MNRVDRRRLLKLSAAGVLGSAALPLPRAGIAQEKVTIRYGWWGGADRQRNYTRALEKFEAQNPDIDIEPEPAEYEAFQERLTTQIPAGDVPDIFWIASPQVMTYHANNLYRPLESIPSLDLSDHSPEAIESFKLGGELNTMPFGVFAPVLRYNETFAADDGVEVPTVESGQWTWDGLAAFLTDYAQNNAAGRKGIAYNAHADLPFEAWLRQRGEQLWTEDGTIGFTEESLAAWFDWWENLRKAGAALSISEQEGPSPDWQLVGDKVLANMGNSNHIVDDSRVFPDYTFRQRPTPIAEGAEEGHKFLYTPRMAMYQGIDEGKIEAAGRLMNYNTNNVEFVQETGLSLGAPVNPRVLQEAYAFANEAETEMLRTVEAETTAPRRPRFEAPPGSSTWRDVMALAIEEVALEQSTVTEAAARMIEEIGTEIERAR